MKSNLNWKLKNISENVKNSIKKKATQNSWATVKYNTEQLNDRWEQQNKAKNFFEIFKMGLIITVKAKG